MQKDKIIELVTSKEFCEKITQIYIDVHNRQKDRMMRSIFSKRELDDFGYTYHSSLSEINKPKWYDIKNCIKIFKNDSTENK